jgi:hypothetical protein
MGRTAVTPQSREIGSEVKNLLPLLLIQAAPIGLALPFVLCLRIGKLTQPIVPVRFERRSDKTVVRVNAAVTLLGEFRLITRMLDVLAAQMIHFFDAQLQLIADGQGDLERERRDDLDEQVADGFVQLSCRQSLTGGLPAHGRLPGTTRVAGAPCAVPSFSLSRV